MEAEKLKKAVEPLANLKDCDAYASLTNAMEELSIAVKMAKDYLEDKECNKPLGASLALSELDYGVSRASVMMRMAAMDIAAEDAIRKMISGLDIAVKMEAEGKGGMAR